MEELVRKCDYCKKTINDKDFYIEIREKKKKIIIDERYHFCDRYCLIEYLTNQHKDRG